SDVSSVHHFELPARKRKRETRRVTLTDKVCAKIKPRERVLDHQPGFYAIGLERGGVSFWAKADVPEALRERRSARTLERVVGRSSEISPRDARLKAAKFVALIKEGIDPTARPARPAAGWALEEAIGHYLTKVERDGALEGSLTQYKAAFKRV